MNSKLYLNSTNKFMRSKVGERKKDSKVIYNVFYPMNSNCDFSYNIILYGRTTFYEIVGVEIVAVYLTIYICLNIQAFEHIYNEQKLFFTGDK